MNYTAAVLSERFGIMLNGQQVEAINLAVDWYRGWCDRKHRRPIFFINGFAGTGKTTVAKIIAELTATMDWTCFIAPTGKAAARLRQKGCPLAKTMHNFIYRVAGEDEDGQVQFVPKGGLEDVPRLVVLDEASMISEYDVDKLTAHKIPLLALGDSGQVPPVKGRQYFNENNAQYTLNQIERNAGNIVRASMFIREGKRLPPREYDDVRVRDGQVTDEELLAHAGDDGVVLVSYNTTRTRLNARIRHLLGFKGVLPQIGEKLVCTFNQHGYNVMNGEQGVVIGYQPVPEGQEDDDEEPDMLLVEYRSLSDGKVRLAKFNPKCFGGTQDEKEAAYKAIGGWDFGWALTVHKSQGSEWNFVLVIEEILRGVPYARMMYTAITRAIMQLTVRRAS